MGHLGQVKESKQVEILQDRECQLVLDALLELLSEKLDSPRQVHLLNERKQVVTAAWAALGVIVVLILIEGLLKNLLEYLVTDQLNKLIGNWHLFHVDRLLHHDGAHVVKR